MYICQEEGKDDDGQEDNLFMEAPTLTKKDDD